MSDTFVPLARTFRELSLRSEDGDEVDYRGRAHGQQLAWADILTRYRTVILSEAGSGKTEEIRHAAQTLRETAPTAFFLRLEHTYEDFDLAFEEGNAAEFDAWLKSDAEGWLFLDSIDEARLREPLDFERAIRRVGQRAGNALQRLHIVISGRGSAWRPVTDLALCEAHLPYHPPLAHPLADAKSGAAAEGAKTGFQIGYRHSTPRFLRKCSRCSWLNSTTISE